MMASQGQTGQSEFKKLNTIMESSIHRERFLTGARGLGPNTEMLVLARHLLPFMKRLLANGQVIGVLPDSEHGSHGAVVILLFSIVDDLVRLIFRCK